MIYCWPYWLLALRGTLWKCIIQCPTVYIRWYRVSVSTFYSWHSCIYLYHSIDTVSGQHPSKLLHSIGLLRCGYCCNRIRTISSHRICPAFRIGIRPPTLILVLNDSPWWYFSLRIRNSSWQLVATIMMALALLLSFKYFSSYLSGGSASMFAIIYLLWFLSHGS